MYDARKQRWTASRFHATGSADGLFPRPPSLIATAPGAGRPAMQRAHTRRADYIVPMPCHEKYHARHLPDDDASARYYRMTLLRERSYHCAVEMARNANDIYHLNTSAGTPMSTGCIMPDKAR